MKAAGVRLVSYARAGTAASRLRHVIPFRTAVACAATILISVAADAPAAEQPDAPTLPQQWAAFANEPAAFAPSHPKPTRRPQ